MYLLLTSDSPLTYLLLTSYLPPTDRKKHKLENLNLRKNYFCFKILTQQTKLVQTIFFFFK